MSRLECLVCLDTLETTSNVYTSRCGHLLHYNCWVQCLNKIPACCPQCRKPVGLHDLLRVYLPVGSNGEDVVNLKNEIDEMRIDLACKAREFDSISLKLAVKTEEERKAKKQCEEFKAQMETLKRVCDAVDRSVIEEARRSMEAMERKLSDQSEELKKIHAEMLNGKKVEAALKEELKVVKMGRLLNAVKPLDETTNQKYAEQSENLKKVTADLANAKKVEAALKEEMKRVKVELNRARQIGSGYQLRSEKIKKYEGVIEGLKNCAHEFDEMKKCKLLAKKLKIFTDDVDASADLKKDVKKDPEKYVEMFQEVRKFWSYMQKKEDEIKKSPKGCIIHLTNFPPNRKDVTKIVLAQRVEYYEGKVAFITYKPGDKEAFVRLQPGKEEKPAEAVIAKLVDKKLRIKNFIVDAKALQGEDEVKFLRRSFEDRDKKIKKVNSCSGLEYLDDTADVSMLEYMMSLVATV